MAARKVVSVSVPEPTYQELTRLATERGEPPSTVAGRLIADGLAGSAAAAPDGPGPVELATSAVFDDAEVMDTRQALTRELALRLARQVDGGGAGAPGASVRLREITGLVTDERDALRQLSEHLSTPVHTYCRRCRAEFDPREGTHDFQP